MKNATSQLTNRLTPAWMRRSALLAAIVAALALAVPAQAQVPAADSDLPVGHFFAETGGSAGPQFGYRITNEGGIPLWSEFQRLGGVPALGYPISRRFQLDGYIVQATQKAILQWRPDASPPQAMLVNVFDKLHDLGYDATLQSSYQIPPPIDPALFDLGKSPDQVRADRLALLNGDPAIAARYDPSNSASVLYNGLPTSTIANAGPFFVLRTQRTALQHWLVDNPAAGTRRGDVTFVNGGDIAKQLGLVSADGAIPETISGLLATQAGVPAPPAAVPPPSASVPAVATPAPAPPAPTPTPAPSYQYRSKEVTDPPVDCSGDATQSSVQCVASAPNIGSQYIKGRVMNLKGDHLQWVTIQATVAGVTFTQQTAGDGTFTINIAGAGSPTGNCPTYSLTYQIMVLDDTGAQASDVRTVTYGGNCNIAGEFHFDFVKLY